MPGRFYAVEPQDVGLYLLPFAVSNFLGPLVLGRYFDVWGRRQMIGTTYALSGLLLGLTAILFVAGLLNAATQTLAWILVFFFASAAASSAYLVVGEASRWSAGLVSHSSMHWAPPSAGSAPLGCSARSSGRANRRRSRGDMRWGRF